MFRSHWILCQIKLCKYMLTVREILKPLTSYYQDITINSNFLVCPVYIHLIILVSELIIHENCFEVDKLSQCNICIVNWFLTGLFSYMIVCVISSCLTNVLVMKQSVCVLMSQSSYWLVCYCLLFFLFTYLLDALIAAFVISCFLQR